MITKIEELNELKEKLVKEHGELKAYGYDCGFNDVQDYEIALHFENKYVKEKCLESVFVEFMNNSIERLNNIEKLKDK